MKLYVLLVKGMPCATNDRDDRYLLCRSKAHGLRTIRWLGMRGAKVVEATDTQIAHGYYSPVHGTQRGAIDRTGEVEAYISALLND